MAPCCAWFVTLVSGAFTVYYAAVASGLYRDPLMWQLQQYGEERRPCLACRLFLAAAVFALSLGMVLGALATANPVVQRIFPPDILTVLAIVLFVGSFIAWRTPALRESLPRWYVYLLRTTSRQERRQIAYAWQRIPRRLRWRLSGDQSSFVVWSELVRLTVIYGAFDPNSPWDVWY
ncbi:MAG: hypothetical protein GX573_06300 [Chloroflexi bacterium]|nr:hypothetical protein [Chloroflexota bacterium]